MPTLVAGACCVCYYCFACLAEEPRARLGRCRLLLALPACWCLAYTVRSTGRSGAAPARARMPAGRPHCSGTCTRGEGGSLSGGGGGLSTPFSLIPCPTGSPSLQRSGPGLTACSSTRSSSPTCSGRWPSSRCALRCAGLGWCAVHTCMVPQPHKLIPVVQIGIRCRHCTVDICEIQCPALRAGRARGSPCTRELCHAADRGAHGAVFFAALLWGRLRHLLAPK